MAQEARDGPCGDCGGTGTIRGTQARYDTACVPCSRLRRLDEAIAALRGTRDDPARVDQLLWIRGAP